VENVVVSMGVCAMVCDAIFISYLLWPPRTGTFGFNFRVLNAVCAAITK